jgi:putative ABC transport system ATP-binding protein
MYAVEAFNIVKDFPLEDTALRVLDNVSIAIRRGELTMLVGPSGCGKTTLLSILTGILSPTSGNVTLFGTPLSQLRDSEKAVLRRRRIGFIFQQYNLMPALTAAENAAIPLLADGVPDAEAEASATAVLAGIGMAEHCAKLPRQLSGGQQQRVAIARALIHNPDLLVCDEPTAALDARTGLAVMNILRERAKSPERAVLIVTHDSRIFHFADRIIEMSDGRIVKDGAAPPPPSDLRAELDNQTEHLKES